MSYGCFACIKHNSCIFVSCVTSPVKDELSGLFLYLTRGVVKLKELFLNLPPSCMGQSGSESEKTAEVM